MSNSPECNSLDGLEQSEDVLSLHSHESLWDGDLENILAGLENGDVLDLDFPYAHLDNSSLPISPQAETLQETELSNDQLFHAVTDLELSKFELDLEVIGEFLSSEKFDGNNFGFLGYPEDQQVDTQDVFPQDTTSPVFDELDQVFLQPILGLAEENQFTSPQETFTLDELLHDPCNGFPTFMSSSNGQYEDLGGILIPADEFDIDFHFPSTNLSIEPNPLQFQNTLKLPSLGPAQERAQGLQIGTKEYDEAHPTQTEEERGRIFLDFRQTHQSLRDYKIAKSNEQVISPEEKLKILTDDFTFPTTEEEQRRDHRDLYMAIRDCNYANHVKEVSSRLQQPIAYKKFTVGYGEAMESQVQSLCWEMLQNLINEQMKYVSAAMKKSQRASTMTFAMRKEKLIQAFLHEKDIPKRLLEESFISQVARDPDGHSSRVRNNRRVNDKKGVQIKAGARALRSASNPPISDEDNDEPEEVTQDQVESSSRATRAARRRRSTSGVTNAGVSKPTTRPKRHPKTGS